MKKLYIIIAAIFIINVAKAQPSIQWQKSLGGSLSDEAFSIQQTTDGGYIVAGSSFSNDGDVIGHHGNTTNTDYWVVKLDATGTIAWQKSLGGTNYDFATSIQQTADDGYIVAGFSQSNDGDVIGHHGTSDYNDYWVVKLNTTGAITWQKSLGGTDNDRAYSIQQTYDGGYIVAGHSYSNDGDVTDNHGNSDYWVVKLNATGAITWQKSLGGTDNDFANSIRQTADGGYIIIGSSFSNDGDVTEHHGSTNYGDYWVIKLNATGTKTWQKSLGGSSFDYANSIEQTMDGGYIVAGNSCSNDGDVTGHYGTTEYNDYWIVKLDSTGIIPWQKSLGGTNHDVATSIQQTTDGGYIVAGHSYSNDGDVTGNHGISDYWIVKLNATGTLAWQKSFGGTNHDEATSIQQSLDGGYIVAGLSLSNDGEVTGHHGTTTDCDYWVVKLSPVIGIKALSKNNNNLIVYPNLANKIITIETIANNIGQVTIININGQEVKKLKVKGAELQIDVNDLPGGLYFVKVWNEQGMSTAKFVKE